MAKGSVPRGDPKNKRREKVLLEDDKEKMPGQKFSRSLLKEALAVEVEDHKHKERVALEQEKYTKKSARVKTLT